jgi:hypothetical protein
MIKADAVSYDKLANPWEIGTDIWSWTARQGGVILFEKLAVDGGGSELMVIKNHTNNPNQAANCLKLVSTSSDASTNTSVLTSQTSMGRAASFSKIIDDNKYAVTIQGANSSSEGLYVQGNIDATGTITGSVKTTRGTEAVFYIEGSEVEIYSSGKARLAGGRANVSFDRLFTESVSSEVEVRVTVTPVGGWSALYLESTSPEGFDVRSAAGDKDAEFHWMACGRRKGYETRPEVTIPEPR